MKKRSLWRILFWANLVARLALLTFLVLLLVTQVVVEPPIVISDISTQRVRGELLAKNALILEYYWSNVTDRAQAVSEIQDSLPRWEAEESVLQRSKNDAVGVFNLASPSDFLPIDVAAHTILSESRSGPADPIQVQIILAHERPYELTATQLVMSLSGEVTSYDIELFLGEMTTCALILLLSAIEQGIQWRHLKRGRNLRPLAEPEPS